MKNWCFSFCVEHFPQSKLETRAGWSFFSHIFTHKKTAHKKLTKSNINKKKLRMWRQIYILDEDFRLSNCECWHRRWHQIKHWNSIYIKSFVRLFRSKRNNTNKIFNGEEDRGGRKVNQAWKENWTFLSELNCNYNLEDIILAVKWQVTQKRKFSDSSSFRYQKTNLYKKEQCIKLEYFVSQWL